LDLNSGNNVRKSLKTILSLADLGVLPLLLPAALLLKAVRRVGLQRLPLCRSVLRSVGVLPVRKHYYEPLVDPDALRQPLEKSRDLPGMDWNIRGQLDGLESFHFTHELDGIPDRCQDDLSFHFNNGAFESGDAEYWYQLLRAKKPRRVIEIGSGNSTLMARKAIEQNKRESNDYSCVHICVEPYEKPWLEKAGVQVVRKRVEEVDRSLFGELESGDILFIDSSHVIRPQGDVLFEYLELLPTLKRGVIVHVHDIFSPRDYLKEWVIDEAKLWNEQYLLEAFLTSNNDWRILGALNYLHHDHAEKLKAKCPYLTPDREPGSFYMEKVR
jgi:Methyltransferase domain